jgi:hypothetical protein
VERLAGAKAADALRAPFVLGRTERLAELVRAAGIGRAAIGLQEGRGRFSSIRSMVEADVRGWLPLIGIVLEEAVIAEILRRAEAELRPFVLDEGGGVSFASPAVLLTAVKPPS